MQVSCRCLYVSNRGLAQTFIDRASCKTRKMWVGEEIEVSFTSNPRLERQLKQSAEEALKEVPVLCDVGTKKNSKGYKETWIS